jgi:hypothetical protein
VAAPHDQPVAVWVRHRLAVEALRRVLAAFEGRGIRVLPVKGIILAHTLYENVTDRPMADVDLRIRPSDLRNAKRVAREHGWDVRITSKQLGTFEFDVGGMLVDVETTVGPPGVCAIGVAEMLERSAERTEPLGVRHREPEIHDHALLLCVNAFKDKLPNTLPWAATDLVRIAELAEFDPDAMVARAREARLTTMVWLVAEWLSNESNTATAWVRVLERLGDEPRRRFYARAFRALVHPQPRSPILSAALVRACSDDALMRGKALALGAAGTAYAWCAGRFRTRQAG